VEHKTGSATIKQEANVTTIERADDDSEVRLFDGAYLAQEREGECPRSETDHRSSSCARRCYLSCSKFFVRHRVGSTTSSRRATTLMGERLNDEA